MRRLLRLLAYRPWVTLAATVLITGLALAQIVDLRTGRPHLRIDPSTNRLIPPESEERRIYDWVRTLFGSDETMIVALSDPRLFTPEILERVQRMTERFEALPEVHHVVSLTNALNIRGTEEGLDIRPFARPIPREAEALARMRREMLENPVYGGNLVSRDGITTALVIYFLDFSDADFIEQGIDAKIAAIAQEEAGDARVWVTGVPHVKVAQFRYQVGDLRRSAPLILLVSALVLAVAFRTGRGVVLPLLTCGVALVWTLGVAAWTGRPLNVVTALIIPLFLILPLSYCVHVVSEWYETLRDEPTLSPREASARALGNVALPVLLTGLTTGAGFVALILSPIDAIREFGMLAVGGIVVTVIASLAVPPALLGLLPRPRERRSREPRAEDRFTRFATRVAAFDLRRRRAIFVAAALLGVGATCAAMTLHVGAVGIRTFPSDSPVRVDFEAVNAQLEGANLFYVVVQGNEAGTFASPENLRTLEALQEWLEAQPEIGGTSSIVDYVKLIHRGFFANDPAKLSIPDSKRLTTQLLFFGASDELEGLLDATHRIANVTVRAKVIDTELVSALLRRIEARVAALPEHLEVHVTGNPILVNRVFDDIVRGQAWSVAGAFLLIYAILAVMFLDWRTAAVALIPNALPVAFYFGALGLTGVTLNFATSLIAPMALGIAIDDTIHYFSRFTHEARRLANERQATVRALRIVGRPVTFTTLVLCLDFAVLTGSDLLTFVEFGALGAMTLAFAWVVDFTLTPALCSGLRIVTLWDTLTIDLGDEPQRSVPLLRGLSSAQCRIVAQLADLREARTGEVLMREGDPGDDMYVIIHGTVRVWIESENGPRELIRCGRGAVLGEVGFFTTRPRSSSNDVVEDAVLLHFTPRNLERLQRRRPRIASVLLANLNRIQAERLFEATERERH